MLYFIKGDDMVHKKLICLLLGLLVVFTPSIIVCAAGSPTVFVSTAEANPGDTVELDVVMNNNPGINTFSFDFDYDTSKLQLINVTVDENLGGQFAYKKKAVWLNSKDIKYNGNILKLKFEVADTAQTGETTICLTYSPGDISNYNEQDINFNIVSGMINIKGETNSTSLIQRIIQTFKKIIELLKSLFITTN